MPSTWTVPSCPRPPRAVKKKFVAVPVIDCVEVASSVNDSMPGTTAGCVNAGVENNSTAARTAEDVASARIECRLFVRQGREGVIGCLAYGKGESRSSNRFILRSDAGHLMTGASLLVAALENEGV